MSKTVVSLLEIGVAVAAVAIGQPEIAAAINSLGVAAGTASTIASVLVSASVALGVQGAVGLFQPGAPKPQQTEPAEKPLGGPPRDIAGSLLWMGADHSAGIGGMIGIGSGRRGNDDLFEIDHRAPVIRRRTQ